MAVRTPDQGAVSARSAIVALFGAKRKSRRLGSSLEVRIPALFLVVVAFLCFVWPLIVHLPPSVNGSVIDANLPLGSPGHFLGTDPLGNDIFSRLLAGGRVSLEVGVATQTIGIVIGGLLGMFAGYTGGWPDTVLMRALDMLIAFPSLVLVLAIIDGLGPGELHIIWALSFFSVPAFARLSRTATLRIREQSYIVSSRVAGAGPARVIVKHVLPNVAPQLFTFFLLGAGVAILIEGALSYLGYGIKPPGASWGNMIAEGQTVMSAQPRLVVVPSLVLLVTVVSLNTLGDGLRARWGVT